MVLKRDAVACEHYRPDHNGECLNCDEPLDAHEPHVAQAAALRALVSIDAQVRVLIATDPVRAEAVINALDVAVAMIARGASGGEVLAMLHDRLMPPRGTA